MPVRRPTMTDVAKAAGVSQSTVSMVLNNMSGARLSAETRSRVLGVAMELGYRLPRREQPAPQAIASASPAPGLRRSLIGYLVDEISTSPHPVVSVDGARDAAWEHDCLVSVIVTRSNADQEAAAIAALRANPMLLGIVYSTIFTREVTLPAALTDAGGLPVVLLNCHDERHRLPTIVPGEIGGGHAATEHLIAMGHTRIGFINGEPWMEAAKDRLKGYRRALEKFKTPQEHTAMLGDKLLTDILGAKRSGVLALMVEPKGGARGPWQKVLHALQEPFKRASAHDERTARQ